jgi:tetratricopeptide (TPR) repeat protein
MMEKVPFLVISAIFCIVALQTQHRGFQTPAPIYPLSQRIYNALLAYNSYIFKSVWPRNLAVFYPFPHVASAWPLVGSFLSLTGISVLAAVSYRRCPYLITGWLWFLGTLVPVIGLVQIGRQSMADRYMYVPLIGLAIMAVWGVSELFSASARRTAILGTIAGIALLALAGVTRQQLTYWHDSIALLDHTLQVTPPNYFTQALVGSALFEKGRYAESLPHFQEAVRMNPTSAMAYYHIGVIQLYNRDIQRATRNFYVALSLDPSYESARRELSRCLAIQGMGGGR